MTLSDYIEESTKEGEIPTINGTGACKNSFKVEDKMGIKVCSHLKGNKKDVNASQAYPSMVLD